MFAFIKKLLGYPTEAEKAAAKSQAEAPYKVEVVPVSHTEVVVVKEVANDPAVEAAPAPVAETPKKEKKPRAPKAEKAAKPKKPAAMTAKKPGRKPKAK